MGWLDMINDRISAAHSAGQVRQRQAIAQAQRCTATSSASDDGRIKALAKQMPAFDQNRRPYSEDERCELAEMILDIQAQRNRHGQAPTFTEARTKALFALDLRRRDAGRQRLASQQWVVNGLAAARQRVEQDVAEVRDRLRARDLERADQLMDEAAHLRQLAGSN